MEATENESGGRDGHLLVSFRRTPEVVRLGFLE